MLKFGLSWIVFAGVYLGLVGSVSAVEAFAAMIAGGLGAVWVRQLARCDGRRFAFRSVAFSPLLRAIGGLPVETARVGARLIAALARGGVTGADQTLPPSGAAGCPLAGDDPGTAASRAVSVLAASLSPDSYVVRLEPERGQVLLHSLLPLRSDARP